MTPRPERKKSSLGRLSPADPAAQQATQAPAPAETAPADAVPRQPDPAPPAGAARSARQTPAGEGRKFRHKVSFYQEEADTARVRAAILNTYPTEGARTLSQFIHHAVMAEVKRLEDRYNDGEPWTGIGARELPQGRPMGH
jgi:hypothetical protein